MPEPLECVIAKMIQFQAAPAHKMKMHKRGFSLLEIIVSLVLIILVLTGMAHLFVAGKRLILHGHSRLAGGELGKVFLDPLQMQVRQDTWDAATNDLSTGTRYCDGVGGHTQQQNCPTQAERTLGNIEYKATYVISDLSPNMRKVVTTLSWSEPTP